MRYIHRCVFCSWHRSGAAATMLDPHCERCGCLLEAVPREEFVADLERRRAARIKAARAAVVSPRALLARRVVRLGATLVIAAALGSAGYRAGGAAIAAGSFAIATLFSLNVLFPGR
jgi:hypothetical protein